MISYKYVYHFSIILIVYQPVTMLASIKLEFDAAWTGGIGMRLPRIRVRARPLFASGVVILVSAASMVIQVRKCQWGLGKQATRSRPLRALAAQRTELF